MHCCGDGYAKVRGNVGGMDAVVGEYLCKIGEDGRAMLDDHSHLVIDHDLNGIADAFVNFARKQKFSFWQEG